MRARDRDVPAGAGAAFGLDNGVVGLGDALDAAPSSFAEALLEAGARHGPKAERMLRRFAALPIGVAVWTETTEGYRLGRITGAWRYDDSPAAHRVGIHHVRPAEWLGRVIGDREVPPAVAATFARGGRNLQQIHDEEAECETAELWPAT